MRIEYYEKIFLWLSIAAMAVFLVAIGYSVFVHGDHLPTASEQVDPTTLEETAPFDSPGIVDLGNGRYSAVMVGKAWQFVPSELTFPTGATVDFEMSAPDIIHGFKVVGTNVNIMLLPGEVSKVSHTFDEPGEYLVVCHEYCGLGHQAMFGKIIVEDGAEAGPLAGQEAGADPARRIASEDDTSGDDA